MNWKIFERLFGPGMALIFVSPLANVLISKHVGEVAFVLGLSLVVAAMAYMFWPRGRKKDEGRQ